MRYPLIITVLWATLLPSAKAENQVSLSSDTITVSKNDAFETEDYDDFVRAYQKDTHRKLLRESFAAGRIPLGYVSLKMKDLIGYNKYEGFRTGIGIETNRWFSKRFKLGGYWRYGHQDEETKFGLSTSILIYKENETWLFTSYKNDIREIGETEFLEEQNIYSSENFRRLVADQFYGYEEIRAGIIHQWDANLKSSIYWKRLQITDPSILYPTFAPIDKIHFNSLGIKVRFRMNKPFPIFFLNAERSLGRAGFDVYYHTMVKIEDSFKLEKFGTSTISLIAAITEEDGIANLFLSPSGSFNQWGSLYSKNSFSTMRPNEFYANKMAAVFFKHHLGALFPKSSKFNPEPSVLFNAGFGSTDQTYDSFPGFAKGYFETGILIDKLLCQRMASYGICALYRLGPYAFNNFTDNLSVQISIDFNF